jgi:dipeptidyl-peptidase-4
MSEKLLTNEDVAKGCPGLFFPTLAYYSPHGNLLSFLYPDSTGKRQLYGVSLSNLSNNQTIIRPYKLIDLTASMSEKLSLEEQLRRERMRMFSSGISSYEWSKSIDIQSGVVIPMNGQIFFVLVKSDGDSESILLYDGSIGNAIDPHLSPDGSKLAFVINNDLYLQYLQFNIVDGIKNLIHKSFLPIRLTTDGSQHGVSSGVADYLAQEEMDRFFQ